jgi:hypothetical protein
MSFRGDYFMSANTINIRLKAAEEIPPLRLSF